MKKGLGIVALLGGAAFIAYKAKQRADEKELERMEQELENYTSAYEDVEEKLYQEFQDIKSDLKEEQFSSSAFPHLNEEDIIAITKNNDENFEQLKELAPEDERPIQHRVTFDKEIELESFKAAVIGEGYVVTSGDTDKELLVLHISKMEHDAISSKVLHLADFAKAHGGIYEGWICKQA